MKKILFVVILAIYCFAGQGIRGIYDSDEGRYTCVANTMITSGNGITPFLNSEDKLWSKPPLEYWAIAGSIMLFGKNEYAARFPGALAYFLTILLVLGIAQTLFKERAWVAPLIYATFIFPSFASNIITTDDLLTLWETAAVFAFVRNTWENNKQKYSLWIIAIWFFFGLAFMTKGPVGLLPLMAIVIYKYCRRSHNHTNKPLWVPGIIVFLLVILPWFLIVIHENNGLLSYFIKNEIIGRVAGIHHRNSQWYGAITVYVPVLLLGTLPWTYLIVRSGYHTIKSLIREKLNSPILLNEKTRFLLLWFVCPLPVFVIARSRLPLYILPLFIPLSLLLGYKLSTNHSFWSKSRQKLIGGWIIILLLLRVAIAYIPYHNNARLIANTIQMNHIKQYDVITFFNVNPRYGLSFYLNKEIEAVNWETLDDELHENKRRLWVVKSIHRSELTDAFKQKSKNKLKVIGTFGKKYTILQELQSTKTPPK